MTIGTIFTLFVLPAVYVLIAKDHSHDRARQAALEPVNLPESQPVLAK